VQFPLCASIEQCREGIAAARLPPALEPVAAALSASDAAGTRSNELFTRCQAVLNKVRRLFPPSEQGLQSPC
jgi:hypothetical protein